MDINIPTVIIGAALAAVVVLIIVKLVRDKKKGRSTCGCGCEHCAMSDACHGKSKDA